MIQEYSFHRAKHYGKRTQKAKSRNAKTWTIKLIAHVNIQYICIYTDCEYTVHLYLYRLPRTCNMYLCVHVGVEGGLLPQIKAKTEV